MGTTVTCWAVIAIIVFETCGERTGRMSKRTVNRYTRAAIEALQREMLSSAETVAGLFSTFTKAEETDGQAVTLKAPFPPSLTGHAVAVAVDGKL